MTRGPAGAAWVAFVAAALFTFAAAKARGSPGSSVGFGTRSPALSGATVADGAGPFAAFENPAGLVLAPGTTLAFGYGSASYDLRADGNEADLESIRTVDFGAVVPGRLLGLPVAFGLALSLPNGRFSRLRTALPSDPYWPLDDARSKLFDLGMALAVEPIESLSFGVGVGFLAAVRGSFRVVGSAVSADGSGAEFDSSLTHAVDADLVSVRYPILGARFEPFDSLALGFGYRGEARVEQRVTGLLLGSVRVGLTDIPVRYSFQTSAIAAFLPAAAALGARFRALDRLALYAELEHQRWSSYPSAYASASAELEASPPPDVTIEPPPDRAAPAASGFSDRLVPRIGVEGELVLGDRFTIALRAGYAYEASPAPDRQPDTLLMDFDRHLVGAGAEAVIEHPLEVIDELHLEASLSLGEGIERGVVTGPDSAPIEHRADGRVIAAGVSLGLVFAGPAR